MRLTVRQFRGVAAFTIAMFALVSSSAPSSLDRKPTAGVRAAIGLHPHRSFSSKALTFGLTPPGVRDGETPSPARETRALPGREIPALQRSRQLLVVTSANWSTVSAELRCYQRPDAGSTWAEAFAVGKVVLGKNGLGWGVGLHGTSEAGGPVKREGDGRAPAGVFRLVEAFGYATEQEANISGFPYRHLTETVEGIDDPASRHYNRLVDAASVSAKDWRSSEIMRRRDELYRWGVVVGHNWEQVPHAGSCIFLHIWEGADVGTSGCTAMPSEQMLRVVRWLRQGDEPILVQLPADQYRELQARWGLP